MSFIQNFKEWSSSSLSFLFLECVWLTEKVLNPDKSDYTNFTFTSETQSRQKQTNKQTKQKQNRSNIQQMNSMWPCGHASVKDLRSQISSCGKWYTTCSWVCHWCSYHIQSLLKSIGEQTHDNHESTWFNPLHPYIRIHLLHTLLCMFSTDKENLLNNQSFFGVAIISFILMILVNDSAILLRGENRCWSLSGFNRG